MNKIYMGSGRLKKEYLQLKVHHRTKTAKRILQSKRSENRQYIKKEKKKVGGGGRYSNYSSSLQSKKPLQEISYSILS